MLPRWQKRLSLSAFCGTSLTARFAITEVIHLVGFGLLLPHVVKRRREMLVKMIGFNQQPLVEFVDTQAVAVFRFILIKLPVSLRSELRIFRQVATFGTCAVSGVL